MYRNQKILALIPARKNSKGVPGKNKYICAGKPLVEWTILAAKKCPLLDAIYCSTDDLDIAEIAKKNKISVIKRPAYLAQDSSKTLGVILHALKQLEKESQFFDYLVLLQPTSPLRTAADITTAIKTLIKNGAGSLASVNRANIRAGLLLTGKSTKTGLKTKSLAKNLADVPRQKYPPIYYVNGAVYVWKRSFLKRGAVLNAPETAILLPDTHTVDIDSIEDLKICEKLLKSAN